MDRISALMDGELDENDAQQALRRIRDAAEARESWATYHVIGDVLRGEGRPVFDVSLRVAAALAAEPVVLAPRQRTVPPRWRTYALSAAASVAAVAVVGWMAFSTVTPPVEVARNAAPLPPVQAAPEPVSMPNDGQMNDYLLAHQGVSPTTSLHGVAPYVRTIAVATEADR